MKKLLEIPITKATLFIYETDLLAYLPPNIIREGLQRGKAILRSREAGQRLEKRGETNE